MCGSGAEADRFVPVGAPEGDGPLSAFLSPLSARVAEHFASHFCPDRDALVLVPFSQSVLALQATARHARVVASDPNPLTALLQSLILSPPSQDQVKQVLGHLGDRTVQGQRLGRYLSGLFETSCPSCHRSVIADAFLWDRELGRPIERLIKCEACGVDAWVRTSPEDLERVAGILPKGYHYWRVLERLARRDQALYTVAQNFLGLYTPRNLHALDVLILESEAAFEGEEMAPLRDLARAILIGCVELCCSLQPGPGLTLPRQLRPPRRFLEQNVWRVFEEGAGFWLDWAEQTASPSSGGRVRLCPGSVGDAAKSLGEEQACLAVLCPPLPHPIFWHLSYFWTGWLLGKTAAERLRSLLYLAGPAWTWYVRALARSLGVVAAQLREDAPLVLSFKQDRYLAESVALAALLAGYQPSGGAVQFPGISPLSATGARCSLVFRRGSKPVPVDGRRPDLGELATEAVVELLAALEEPASIPQLWSALVWRLTSSGDLALLFEQKDDLPVMLAGLEDALRRQLVHLARTGVIETLGPLERGRGRVAAHSGQELRRLPRFWRRRRAWSLGFPLTDRVEAAVWRMLLEGNPTAGELAQEVYGRFRGCRTPPEGWCGACLRSYAEEGEDGRWYLREEDQLERRQDEVAGLIQDLHGLGEALGFAVVVCRGSLGKCRTAWEPASPCTSGEGAGEPSSLAEPFAVGWLDGQELAYVFALSWTSSVVPVMVGSGFGPAGVQRCLVIPGGRSTLLHYRQTRAGWLPPVLERGNWHFIKFRHLRQLSAGPQTVSRSRLRQIIGLDPIVERADAQMPLF